MKRKVVKHGTKVRIISRAEYEARLPVVDLANDANDDWLKKADPKAREEELALHDELASRHGGGV